MSQHMNKVPEFWDESRYLEIYTDVAIAVAKKEIPNGYIHFILYGRDEGRKCFFIAPTAEPYWWNENVYIEQNPDVEKLINDNEIPSALYHYVNYGRETGYPCYWDNNADKLQQIMKVDSWVISEMIRVSEYEPNIHPQHADNMLGFYEYNPLWKCYAGDHFVRVIKKLSKQKYTHLFLLPWIKSGGADKAALIFIQTAASKSGNKVLVMTSEDTESTWINQLPVGVDYIDFGKAMLGIELYDQSLALCRLIIECEIDKVHVINSHVGWHLLCRYGKPLSFYSKLFTSLYCYDFTEEGEPVGYARHVKAVVDSCSAIFSDNQSFPKYLSNLFGVPLDKFKVTYHPAMTTKSLTFNPECKDVLWASRLDRQKRPDLLLAIAKLMPKFTFHVYGGFVTTSVRDELNHLLKIRNIRYHGPFNSFDEIQDIGFLCFLYTSQWDGLPNILLEVGQAGLPIVSSNVGGISELISSETGYLTESPEIITTYVSLIDQISSDSVDAELKINKLKALILNRHSKSAFSDTLNNVADYL